MDCNSGEDMRLGRVTPVHHHLVSTQVCGFDLSRWESVLERGRSLELCYELWFVLYVQGQQCRFWWTKQGHRVSLLQDQIHLIASDMRRQDIFYAGRDYDSELQRWSVVMVCVSMDNLERTLLHAWKSG